MNDHFNAKRYANNTETFLYILKVSKTLFKSNIR